MAHHADLEASSTSEATKYKMESSTPVTDLVQNHSRSGFRLELGTGPGSLCIGYDSPNLQHEPDLESQLSESIFSQMGSVSSAESDISSPPSLPVTLYSTPTEFPTTTTELSYIKGDGIPISASLPTSHLFVPTGPRASLDFSNPIHIRFPSMDSNRAVREPSPGSVQSSSNHPFVAKLTKRHQTFPLDRNFPSSDEPWVLPIRKHSTPGGTIFAQNNAYTKPERALNRSFADGNSVTKRFCEAEYRVKPVQGDASGVEGVLGTGYTDRANTIKVEDEWQLIAPVSVNQLKTSTAFDKFDLGDEQYSNSVPTYRKHDKTYLGTRQERLSASSRAETIRDESVCRVAMSPLITQETLTRK